MNGGVSSQTQPPPAGPPQGNPAYAHLTPEQQARIQEDLADRERQASALAAAGMVADSVSLTRPATAIGNVLQAPPPLGGMAPPAIGVGPDHNGHPPMESINWNLDFGTGLSGSGLDDMDMDFATLFDAEQEQNFMFPDTSSPPPGSSPHGGEEPHSAPNPLNAT
jgi:hypothetical protein